MGVFDFFRKKKNVTNNVENVAKHEEIVYNHKIKYNVNPPTKIYEESEEEKQFVENLFIKSSANNLQPNKYSFTRLSNGTINVDYDYSNKGGFVGKVKIQGRKKFIMYMKNMYDSETIEGELTKLINAIELWINYINRYLK